MIKAFKTVLYRLNPVIAPATISRKEIHATGLSIPQ
jgi:hypothetical protein